MSTLALSASALSEIEIVQNPALGAYAIWRFGIGFQSEDGRPPAFPLAFLVLPLVLHRPTLVMIGSTQRASGLALFAAKLSQERENLLAVHERALALRRLTLQSIAMGVGERLLTLDYVSATIRANTPEPTVRKLILPERIRAFSGAAEKVGYWFSKLGLHQVTSTLAVEF
jgi:ABC-3C biological conflict system middle component